MKRIGFIGWRGMVGRVLLNRMSEEGDWNYIDDPTFFSTSLAQNRTPSYLPVESIIKDAYDLRELMNMDVIVTCQGGGHTNQIYPSLKKEGWPGIWIDSSSALRMNQDSVIVLDPVNKHIIEKAKEKGIKTFVGGNCTVSLMAMALHGLFQHDLIEWVSSMAYMAASGAGSKNLQELVMQINKIGSQVGDVLNDPEKSILDIDSKVTRLIQNPDFPIDQFKAPLACSLIPWIDSPMENGQTREEWKGEAETNKILGIEGKDKRIPVDGICVRIPVLRSHSQALTIKLKKDVPLDELNQLIENANQWVKIIPNEKDCTLKNLNPVKVSNTLDILVGRVRKMSMGSKYLTLFTTGDQLLWGAAEPIRRCIYFHLRS